MSRPDSENSERVFLFMPTVYQRNKVLQANLDKKQLSIVGELVSAAFKDPSSTFGVDVIPTRKRADGTVFQPWDYSNDFTPVIDNEIRKMLEAKEKPKRKRIGAIKVKIE